MTIIIVNYNCSNFIDDCVASINKQNSDFNLVIIDDCSLDGSQDKIKKYSKHHDIYLNEKNLGLVNTLNKYLKLINSRFFLILNSDDLLKPNSLNIIKDYLNSNDYNEDFIYTFDMEIFGPFASQLGMQAKARCLDFNYVTGESSWYWDFKEETKKVPPNIRISGSSIFSKKSFLDVGGYREPTDLPEDADFFNRIMNKPNSRLIHIPFPVVQYRQHNLDQTNNRHFLISIILDLNKKISIQELRYLNLEVHYQELINSKTWKLMDYLRFLKRRMINLFKNH